eukprot:784849_1
MWALGQSTGNTMRCGSAYQHSCSPLSITDNTFFNCDPLSQCHFAGNYSVPTKAPVTAQPTRAPTPSSPDPTSLPTGAPITAQPSRESTALSTRTPTTAQPTRKPTAVQPTRKLQKNETVMMMIH